jgi:ribokinase
MSSKKISVIGSLNVDLVTITPRVPSGGETLTASSFSTGPGGKGANQAVASARLSRPNPTSTSSPTSDIVVKMLGAVGADEFGPPLLAGMEADGIEVSSVSVVPGQTTGVAVILVEESTGENRILLNPGANHTLQPQDFTSVASLGTPSPDLIIMQLEIPLPTVLQILKTAEEANIQVLLNPAPAVKLPEEVYPSITHLIINETEAAILTGRSVEEVEAADYNWDIILNDFLAKGVSNVIITLGAKGAVFSHSLMKKPGFVPAEKVAKVVDTTAAGDTFVGAYAVNIVRNGRKGVEEEDIMLACKAAGRTVEKHGAQNSIPWADEV